MAKIMTNCSNCGAPLSGAKCEYCGSINEEFAPIDFEKALNQWRYEEAKRELIRAKTQINNVEQTNYILSRMNSNFEPVEVEPYHSFSRERKLYENQLDTYVEKHNKLVERLVNFVERR